MLNSNSEFEFLNSNSIPNLSAIKFELELFQTLVETFRANDIVKIEPRLRCVDVVGGPSTSSEFVKNEQLAIREEEPAAPSKKTKGRFQ